MLIIAEIGLNHNGDINLAKCLAKEAKNCGADIAKFQFFDASQYFTPEFEWYDACMKARLSFEQAAQIKRFCDDIDIEFLASVFDLTGVEWAEKLKMRRYKIPSRAINQKDLIKAVCDTGKDIIVALGMWDKKEFPKIITKGKVDFLYCVAKYPAMPEDLELSKIDFSKYSGFSDHTIGIDAALVAAAKGAKIIEKHFTLSKEMYGPDHAGSMDPGELRELVRISRKFEKLFQAEKK